MTTRKAGRARAADRPIRVAIIGGGCAGMAAAFELSSPHHRGRYKVTVYQQGFRLGGKGASGRGPHHRVEEHGMHFWMGFYDNSFRMLRRCYEELGRDPLTCPITRWDEALSKVPAVAVMHRSPEGAWMPQVLRHPPRPGLPGDPPGPRLRMRDYVVRAAEAVLTFIGAALEADGAAVPRPRRAGPGRRGGSPERLSPALAALFTAPALLTTGAILQAAEALRDALSILASGPPVAGALAEAPLGLLRVLSAVAERHLDRTLDTSSEVGWLWAAADLFLAAIRGVLRHGLLDDPRGFDAVDGVDIRTFLRQNGACRASLRSALVRGGIYDHSFAYASGRPDSPSFSAGAGLRALFRMFLTYRGSFYYRMNAGMGDVVFAPLYELLSRRRGVDFRFFHRLRDVRLTPAAEVKPGERPLVEELHFDLQAETLHGKPYAPLIDVDGLPCWPSEPLWDQLDVGDARPDFESHWDAHRARPEALLRGEDFDLVVLAVGLGAVPHVAPELVARSPRWKKMVERVETVATQSLQLWVDAGTGALGWPNDTTAFIGFEKPFESWADMSHVAAMEGWRRAPRSVHYFTGALPEPEDPADAARPDHPTRRREDVARDAERALTEDFAGIWPAAYDGRGRFRWELLHAEGEGASLEGPARLATQYVRANVNPSDRYTLAVPGSARYRISPLDMDFDNLTVAGDWTSGGLGSGNVESAVMSGLLAAHAVSLSPPLSDIIGFDHP